VPYTWIGHVQNLFLVEVTILETIELIYKFQFFAKYEKQISNKDQVDDNINAGSLGDMNLNEYNMPQSGCAVGGVVVEPEKLIRKLSTAIVSGNGSEESALESSGDESSLGSEFGESSNVNNLKNKLPQVQRDLAALLKLNVTFCCWMVLRFY
jgi:hypothetical protein